MADLKPRTARGKCPLSLAALLPILLLLFVPYSVSAAKDCASCHSGYDPLAISVAAPSVMGVNLSDTFQVELAVPWKHEALEVTVGLNLPENSTVELAPGESKNQTIASISKRTSDSLMWNLVGVKEGRTTLSFEITSISHYDHSSSSKPDYQDEFFSGQLIVEVTALDLGVSPSFILTELGQGGNFSLQLTSALPDGNLTNFSLRGLEGLVSFVSLENGPSSLGPGEMAQLNFSLLKGHTTGKLQLEYLLPDGNPANTTLEVLAPISTTKSANEGSGYYLNVGALYGWLAVVAMLVGMVQGFSKRHLDKRYMEQFKAAKKEKQEWTKEEPGERQGYWWWIHTLLLFVLVIFVYIHVIGVFKGGFPVVFDWPTVLGLVAIVVLTITGLSGLWPKQMKRIFGNKRWKKVHAGVSALALIMGLIHGILLRHVFLV